jgi:hypothetical protein
MCFRDKTFCVARCATKNCPDKLTPELEQRAQSLGLLISVHDYSFDCKQYQEDNVRDAKVIKLSREK